MSSEQQTFYEALDEIAESEIIPSCVVVLRHTDKYEYNLRLAYAVDLAAQFKVPLIQPYGESTLEEAQNFYQKFSPSEPFLLVTHSYHMYRAYLSFITYCNHVKIVPMPVTDINRWIKNAAIERNKIEKYQKKDIASYQYAIKYLQWHFSR